MSMTNLGYNFASRPQSLKVNQWTWRSNPPLKCMSAYGVVCEYRSLSSLSVVGDVSRPRRLCFVCHQNGSYWAKKLSLLKRSQRRRAVRGGCVRRLGTMEHLTEQNQTHQNLLWKMTKFFYRRKRFISEV